MYLSTVIDILIADYIDFYILIFLLTFPISDDSVRYGCRLRARLTSGDQPCIMGCPRAKFCNPMPIRRSKIMTIASGGAADDGAALGAAS